jgi:hypothetical protein
LKELERGRRRASERREVAAVGAIGWDASVLQPLQLQLLRLPQRKWLLQQALRMREQAGDTHRWPDGQQVLLLGRMLL